MGLGLPLIIPLLLISSSLSNPIPLDRAANWSPEDISILEEQNEPQAEQPSDKLSCDNSGAERCYLFPIGCVSGVNCTDRLEMRTVDSGTNIGNIIISLNLHVTRTPHMLVAVPMPDLTNPNSTFLVGCSIDEAVAVVAKPDVDGVTEQLQMPWLKMVAVRATADDLECIVSASPGYVDLPKGDVAVFAGELEQEEEVHQSARIGGTVDDESIEERRNNVRSIERVEEESSKQKISPPHSHERTTHSHEHLSHEPIRVSIEDHGLTTTTIPETTAVLSNQAKLRLKMLHSAENSSAERHHLHRHSSAEKMHSTHAPIHDGITTTDVKITTEMHEVEDTTEIPEIEEATVNDKRGSFEDKKETSEEDKKMLIAVQKGHKDDETTTTALEIQEKEETTEITEVEEATVATTENVDMSTTVFPPHHRAHHHHHHNDSHEHHHKEPTNHSHERATVDKEHQSVRMTPPSSTTTNEKPASFEDDKEISEEDKQLLRAIEKGRVKEERSDDDEEEEERTADGMKHHQHATMYELTREAAQDPIGRRPNEHSHSSHSHEMRSMDDEEEEQTTKKSMKGEKEDEEESEGGRREKNHEKRDEEREEEDDEEKEDDGSSGLSIIIPMVVSLAPLIFG